ncbi:hypothetical protein BHE74_00011911 [Ensete ventricosum]|nr:hypothetical protein BHE74_00011911 [Ensete ventricosum]
MGGTIADASGATTESYHENRVRAVQPSSWAGQPSAAAQNLGSDGTIAAYSSKSWARWLSGNNRYDFGKSDSLRFSNPDLYLLLTNSQVN